MDYQKTSRWHIVISGFTQAKDRPHGMLRLWQQLCQHRDYKTAVELMPWKSDWEELAECMFLCSPSDAKTKIGIYSYSYGTGWGAMQLCKALDKRGMSVDALVSADGVFRHKYAFGAWRALVPWSRIWVPGNVRHVSWFRQKENLPAGHTLLAMDPRKTYIEKPTWIRATHQYLDDSQAFHDECLRTAASLQKEKTHESN